ncbi:MAG: energy transducer TonB [Desulfobulbaceae bacterium]|jgi:protein TonB|nr:energy transducer TonB [Desulfobulbaceae bacterium]
MGRLGPALLLASAMHLLFFLAVVPERMLQLPAVRGSGQVTVSFVRPAPAPVPENTAGEAKKPAARAEQETERSAKGGASEMTPVPQVRPERRKKVIRRERVDGGGPEPGDAGREKGVFARPAPRPAADGGGDVRPSAGREAVRQAAPLAAENRPPLYPELARKRGWEGTVVLAVRVTEEGLVQSVQVHGSSSYRLLDDAALRAVRQWRFQPGSVGGRAAAMQVQVPVHFVLRDEEGP